VVGRGYLPGLRRARRLAGVGRVAGAGERAAPPLPHEPGGHQHEEDDGEDPQHRTNPEGGEEHRDETAAERFGAVERAGTGLQSRRNGDRFPTEGGWMPASKEMPSTIRRSPAKAQRTWAKAHDSAVETYGEG